MHDKVLNIKKLLKFTLTKAKNVIKDHCAIDIIVSSGDLNVLYAEYISISN